MRLLLALAITSLLIFIGICAAIAQTGFLGGVGSGYDIGGIGGGGIGGGSISGTVGAAPSPPAGCGTGVIDLSKGCVLPMLGGAP